MLAPREVAFVFVGAVIGALLGWVGAAVLHQTRITGIVIGLTIGVGVGIGIWRYLSQKARLKRAPTLEVHDSIR